MTFFSKAQKGGHNKSFGQLEGKKIFVHNVSEEAVYEDFQASVEKYGECTDFFNPGRGFAFIEYSTNEAAAACIAGMDNTEVAGRTIQMNIAKPKGEKGNDRGGQGGRGGHNKSFSGQQRVQRSLSTMSVRRLPMKISRLLLKSLAR